MSTEGTASQRLATIMLGQPVREWIAAQRSSGRSWRQISKDLNEATAGEVKVTHEAVRGWHEDVAA